MTDADFGTFDSAFRRLARALRMKVKPADLEELARMYFRLLRAAPLEVVLAAGKTLLESQRKFPLPVDWLNAVKGLAPELAASGADVRVMRDEEAREYTRAEQLRYQDEPCNCLLCQSAGVTHRFLRFVPDFTRDDRDERAMQPTRDRIVTVGHWAHGEELARWYEARDRFFSTVPKTYRRGLRRLLRTDAPAPEGASA